MQDYTLDLAILAAFVALCAVDIGTDHSAVTGLIVVGIGLVVIVVFILVLRFGFGQTTAPTTSVIRDNSVTHANRQRGYTQLILVAGDGAAFIEELEVRLSGIEHADVLLFDLPRF